MEWLFSFSAYATFLVFGRDFRRSLGLRVSLGVFSVLGCCCVLEGDGEVLKGLNFFFYFLIRVF